MHKAVDNTSAEFVCPAATLLAQQTVQPKCKLGDGASIGSKSDLVIGRSVEPDAGKAELLTPTWL